MYFPTTRVLTVLELLQSHPRLSGPELAERLEVNTRTVRRYITMLQDLGIPVEAERGRYGTYRLRPGFKLPPLMFTEEEAQALTLGLLAARKLGLAVEAPAAEGALAKIERVLPDKVRARVQAIYETLIFDVQSPDTTPSGEVIGTLCAAVQQGKQVWLEYQSWQAETTRRKVELYGLVYRHGLWYTVGYCHLRQDLLTPAPWLVDVLLETTLEEARKMVPPALATLEQTSDGVVFRCYVNHLEWIAHFLAGLDCPILIRQPEELYEALQKLAEKIAAMAIHKFTANQEIQSP